MASKTIEMYRGDYLSFTISVVDTNGDALNIANYSILFTVKVNNDDDSNALQKSSSSSTQISKTSPTTGEFTVYIDSADTTNLTPGDLFYDAQITSSDSKSYTVLAGTFRILTDITR